MRKKNNSAESLTIEEILKEIRHYLPSQGPIKDFIHHNTLHAFQEHDGLSFHEAIRQASSLYGSKEYLPLNEYRALYASEKISDEAIDFVLKNEGDAGSRLRHAMLTADLPPETKRPGFRRGGYLYEITQSYGVMLEETVHPMVYRLVANYVDQGIAAISMSQGQPDFWHALRKQFAAARPAGISREIGALIANYSPIETITLCLDKILPEPADRKVFLLEVLMAARGWSGIIGQIEDQPLYLNYPRLITLAHYLALYLALLSERLSHLGYDRNRLTIRNPNAAFFAERAPGESDAEKIARLWHESFEMTFYLQTLAVIRTNAHKKRTRSSAAGKARFQTIFCIDDRECSLRRYLEEISDQVETFSTPGFFAIDAVYQGPFDAISIKQCPVPVTPRHRLRGIVKRKRETGLSRFEMNFWHRYANGVFLGWFISLCFGLVSLIRLVFSIHMPTRTFSTASSFATSDEAAELHYERPEGEGQKDGYFEGYTVSEMAERVGRVLRQIGLTHHFGHLVVLVGHGSSSTNNPYFAAYDCGACSGRPGFVNARAFALMANRDDVRKLLVKDGLNLPVSTRFIGAIHDTARDEIVFIDEDDVMAHHSRDLAELKTLFGKALERNALERTRRFEIINFAKRTERALKEARLRTEMLFEPRPEYNHATNALAIIGRRSLTERLFLDRRAFFNSYDPIADRDGKILNGILTPLVPVCGGINLEYLFSRLDNSVFGAGSKLPHNVFSLLGVGNGAEGDLRTGLPEQMIEIHDPLRLMILVEQRLEIVQKVLRTNDAVRAWIEKDWVKFSVYDPSRKKFLWFRNGHFEALNLGSRKVPQFVNSLAAFENQRDNVAPAVISGGA